MAEVFRAMINKQTVWITRRSVEGIMIGTNMKINNCMVDAKLGTYSGNARLETFLAKF